MAETTAATPDANNAKASVAGGNTLTGYYRNLDGSSSDSDSYGRYSEGSNKEEGYYRDVYDSSSSDREGYYPHRDSAAGWPDCFGSCSAGHCRLDQSRPGCCQAQGAGKRLECWDDEGDVPHMP
jgi:hypothetical protein